MKQHTIIAISGRQGSGKSTLARELCARYAGSHVKFATPLYEMHEAIRGILSKYGYEMRKKEGRLLQLLGTEFGRDTLGQNIWADLTHNYILNHIDILDRYRDKAFIVVDDARFENELDMFLKFKSEFPDLYRVITIRLEADE